MDDRRLIPRTDALLADPRFVAAGGTHGRDRVKNAIITAQQRARTGELAPDEVPDAALAALRPPSSLRPVLNATGVVIHTNLGRAPLSDAARTAILDAAGHTDLEFDLDTGRRGRRGAGVEAALLALVPDAEAALVVNNGAAALVLATTALAATPAHQPREIVISRGELVEIGAGFRLPDLITSTGAILREVGTTNRTHSADYATAINPATAAILKVHPSNFRVEGFTSGVSVADLADLGVPVIVDIGSGLLTPDPTLPDEPDATTALRDGAALVTFSGDKLLGGPQAGTLLGRRELVESLRTHPLARALRIDKLGLAALEATLNGPTPPVTRARRLTRSDLRERTQALGARVGGTVIEVDGRIGGGGAPGVPLPGLAVALPGHPDPTAHALRMGTPAVVARIEGGACLIDLRCIDPSDDELLASAIEAALQA